MLKKRSIKINICLFIKLNVEISLAIKVLTTSNILMKQSIVEFIHKKIRKRIYPSQKSISNSRRAELIEIYDNNQCD